jgi:hypothetical protein
MRDKRRVTGRIAQGISVFAQGALLV